MTVVGPERQPLRFAIIRRLFALSKPHARLRNALLALVLLRAVQLPGLAWITARVIAGPVAQRDLSGLVWGGVGLAAWVGCTAVVLSYRARLALLLGERVVSDLRCALYRRLLELPLSEVRSAQMGRLINRVVHDTDAVRAGVQDVFFVSAVQLGSLAIATGLMLLYDPLLWLVIALMAPGLWALTHRYQRKSSIACRNRSESFARVTASLAESVSGIREIQSFGREAHGAQRFQRLIHEHAETNMAALRLSVSFQPLLNLAGQLLLALVLAIGGYRVLIGSTSLEALIQFLFLSNLVLAAIPILGKQYDQALAAMAGAERVFRVLDAPPDPRDSPRLPEIGPIRGRVRLRGVCFEYEPGRPALVDIDLEVDAGRSVALVGPTGSGKSTLASLIGGIRSPTSGELSIDGKNTASYRSGSLRRQVAVVTQHNVLFTGTVLDNLRMGRPEATREEVERALEELDVRDVIEALPEGLLTRVEERGGGLSLGQRQLVCFARALVARPALLILDEATSAVDPETEARVARALARLLRGRTSFVIAHRLATVSQVDDVVVLQQGRIVEQGPAARLCRAGGPYERLCRELSSGYGPHQAGAVA